MRLLIDSPELDKKYRNVIRACVTALISKHKTAYRVSLKTGLNQGTISHILHDRREYSVGHVLNKLAAELVRTGIWYNSSLNTSLSEIARLYSKASQACVRYVRASDTCEGPDNAKTVLLEQNLVMWVKPWLYNKKSIQSLRELYKSRRVIGISFHNYLAKGDRLTLDPDRYLSGEIESWQDKRCRVVIPKGTIVKHYTHKTKMWHHVRIVQATRRRMHWQGQVFVGKLQNPTVLGFPASFVSEYGYV
jgi:hypothetical protein